MSNYLSAYAIGKDNNFNLLRFTAALMVLVSHSFVLRTGKYAAEPLHDILNTSLGGIAVDIFFVTSGFLITGSLVKRKSMSAFVWARILRIYPALIGAVIFCAFGVGVYFTKLSIADYFSRYETYKFIWKNATIAFGCYGGLPGVFEGAPLRIAVNGSLWTLPWEVRMYGILLALGIFAQAKKEADGKTLRFVVLLVGGGSLLAQIANHFLLFTTNIYAVILLRLMAMFFVGSGFYLMREKVFLSAKLAWVMSAVLVASAVRPAAFFVCYHLFIAYIVIVAAYVPAGRLRLFNRFGDYSYGLYLYAFPVEQALVTLVPGISLVQMMTASFVVTFTLAFLSWHLVEKNMLKMKGSPGAFEKLFHSHPIAERRFKEK